jgi:glutamate-ammonia-ligase adenylyltransferase
LQPALSNGENAILSLFRYFYSVMPKEPSGRDEGKKQAELMKAIEGLAVRAGIVLARFMPALQKDLRANPDPARALNNYHRFLTSGFSDSLLYDFASHRILQTLFLEIAGQSQYLADILVRNPELLRWLTATNELTKTKSPRDFRREARAALEPFERTEKKLDALKRFHRREILRLGAREILAEAEGRIITGELSSLADAIIESVLQVSIVELSKYADSKMPQTLAVIGLGKLGGEELNFSSDIDLMFVYEKDAKFAKPIERMSSLHEYYVRLSETVMRHLVEQTSEGYFYRVDMRLRPYGKSGLLAMSRASYRSYYEVHGEIWERQMLLKARVVAGNKTVGARWMADLKPFLFPKSLVRSPLEEIASIKQKIEKRIEGEENVKLGAGGIRDVEFIVQVLELLNAGNNPALAQNNSLRAIEVLGRTGFFSKKEKGSLEVAYRFLRKVEHRLQLLHGLQTHSLPETSSELLSLARRLGYKSSEKFVAELNVHRRKVRDVFRSVFSPAESREGREKDIKRKKEAAGVGAAGLKRIGFKNIDNATQNFDAVFESLPRLREPSTLEAFLHALKQFGAPDWALQNLIVLTESEPIQRTLTVALLSSRLVELIVRIAARSRRMTTMLAREPLLFESLVSQPEELVSGAMEWKFLMDSDRARYKRFSEFTILLSWLAQNITVREATSRLSEVALSIFRRVADEVYSDMFDCGSPNPIAVVALGKLGGQEISVDSDLDIVFIVDATSAGEAHAEVQSSAERYARSVLGKITSENEKIYDIDVRLRPEGRNAPLISDLEYLRAYFRQRASLWERQALLRARIIWGTKDLAEKIGEFLPDAAFLHPLPNRWRDEMKRMRQRIEEERDRSNEESVDLKTGMGGLLDVEFIVQMLQLEIGRGKPEVRTSNTLEAIEALRRCGALESSEAKKLTFNYMQLRSLELLLRLNSKEKGFAWPQQGDLAAALSAGMAEAGFHERRDFIRSICAENRQIYNAVFARRDRP